MYLCNEEGLFLIASFEAGKVSCIYWVQFSLMASSSKSSVKRSASSMIESSSSLDTAGDRWGVHKQLLLGEKRSAVEVRFS